MSDIFEPIPVGSYVIDCSALAAFLVDLVAGGKKNLRHTREGFDDAVNEIVSNQKEWGEKAGVTQAEIDAILAAGPKLAQIKAALPAARKLVEILEESHASIDNQRNRGVAAIAGSVETRAETLKDPQLLAKYEKARAYRSAIGEKAAKTRKKNELAKKSKPTK